MIVGPSDINDFQRKVFDLHTGENIKINKDGLPEDMVKTAVEEQLLALLEDLQEKRRGIASRFLAIQEELQKVDNDLSALQTTLALYHRHHTPEVSRKTASTNIDIEDLKNTKHRFETTKDLVVHIATILGCEVDPNEIAQILVDIEYSESFRNAKANIYSVIARNPDVFKKIRRGQYELVQPG